MVRIVPGWRSYYHLFSWEKVSKRSVTVLAGCHFDPKEKSHRKTKSGDSSHTFGMTNRTSGMTSAGKSAECVTHPFKTEIPGFEATADPEGPKSLAHNLWHPKLGNSQCHSRPIPCLWSQFRSTFRRMWHGCQFLCFGCPAWMSVALGLCTCSAS